METDFSKEVKEKKRYELSFLAENEEAGRDILRLLGQHGVAPEGEIRFKKINLAYKIKRLNQAYFGFVFVSARPADVKLLEHDLNSLTAVLRFLVLSQPVKGAMEAAAAREGGRRPVVKRPAGRPPASRPQPLSNEALERKIEEILQ